MPNLTATWSAHVTPSASAKQGSTSTDSNLHLLWVTISVCVWFVRISPHPVCPFEKHQASTDIWWDTSWNMPALSLLWWGGWGLCLTLAGLNFWINWTAVWAKLSGSVVAPLKTAWFLTTSYAGPHKGQEVSRTIPFLCRLCLVGRMFFAKRHMKFLILLGISAFHSLSFLWWDGPGWRFSLILFNKWYADLTV